MPRIREEQGQLYPIVGIGLGVVLLFTAWIVHLAVPGASAVSYTIFAAGVLVGVASAIHFRVELMRVLRSRSTTYGAVVALSVLLALGIAVVLNIFAAGFLDRQYDFTKEKYFTLSEQSVQVLGLLDGPVHVIGFFASDPTAFRYRDRQHAEELLELYQRESGGKVSFELVDPYRSPQIAAAYDVEYEALTVFEKGDRRESTTTVSEADFTAALLKLALNERLVIYFVSGHEERRTDDFSLRGMREVADALEAQNYVVRQLALAQQSPMRVPDDAAVVVLAGPKLPLESGEVSALDAYARRGGRLLLLFDPPTGQLQGLSKWLRRWGVLVGDDIVIDMLAHIDNPAVPVGQFKDHRITRSLTRQRRDVQYRFACSIQTADRLPQGLTVEALVQTSDSATGSWAELDRTTYPPRQDPQDTPGPITIALAVSQTLEGDVGEGARMVIVGDSDFAANELFHRGGELLLNAVHWLTLREDLIAIPPKDPAQRRLNPATTAAEQYMLLFVTMGLMPGLFAAVGIVVWIRRR